MKRFLSFSSILVGAIAFLFSCQKQPIGTEDNLPKISFPANVEKAPTVSDAGGDARVSFTATESWTAAIINTRADDWVSVEPQSGGPGPATITISAKPNDTFEDRSASIQIKSGSATEVIVLTQKQKDDITITSSKYDVGRDGGTIKIEVKSNIEYSYGIDEKCASWVSYIETKAYESKTLSFSVSRNDGLEKREGKIVFSSGSLSETVFIYQEGSSPEIIISTNEYYIPSDGQTIDVEVKSNVDVEFAISEGCDWIQEVKTKSMSTNTFKFQIAENGTYDNRAAEIVFSEKNGSTTQKVSITQYQKNAIIIGSDTISASADGEVLSVTINANIIFTTIIEDTAKEWITEVNTKGLVEYEKFFKLEANTTGADRTGRISFKNEESGQTAELTIIQSGVSIEGYDNLSASETANSYIVTTPGKYFFKASVAGNGEKGLLSDSIFPSTVQLAPDSAELIWTELDINISDISLSGENVLFNYTGGKGNALIAAKKNGVIIWSWHIWATDQPELVSMDGYSFMDRNLGAVSPERSNGEKERGLYYQWGRKDPLRGEGASMEFEAIASQELISRWTENPTVFSYSNNNEANVVFAPLWGNPDGNLGSQGIKTIYDPCPSGYTVPDFSFADKYSPYHYYPDGTSEVFNDYVLDNNGLLLRGRLWLPAYGHWDTYVADNQGPGFGKETVYLTNTYYGTNPGRLVTLTIGEGYHNLVVWPMSFAGSVRCVKEEWYAGNAPSVQTVAVDSVRNTSMVVRGRIASNGNSRILSYGVRWGKTKALDTVYSIDGFPSSNDFSINLTDLPEDETLYFQAFATNENGTSYGEVLSVKTRNRLELARNDLEEVYKLMYQWGWTTTGNYHQCFGILSSTLTAEVMGDDFIMSAQGNGWFWYDFTYNVKSRYTTNTWRSADLWNQYYKYVEKANRIIDYLTEKEIPNTNAQLGQALAVRAYGYFMLAQWFSRTYVGHESDKCVPLLTTYAESLKPNKPRASVKEIYDFIRKDIDQACSLLDSEAKHSDPKVIDRFVANAIRAKIYLELADYTKANESAKIAVQGASVAFDPDFHFNDATASSVLWGAVVPTYEGTTNPQFMAHMDYRFGGYGDASRKCASAWLYARMKNTDKRASYWWNYEVLYDGVTQGYQQYKFLFKYPSDPQVGDRVYMRAAEMQLVIAETACRLGNESEAKEALNALMETRDANYDCSAKTGTSLASITTDETGSLLEEIILQRRIELWGEAGRIFDIKRLKQGFDRSVIEGWPSGSMLTDKNTKDSESFDWVMTIPKSAFDANPAMDETTDQNPF